jgi:hypothetical protein
MPGTPAPGEYRSDGGRPAGRPAGPIPSRGPAEEGLAKNTVRVVRRSKPAGGGGFLGGPD